MEDPFYRGYLEESFAIETLTPREEDRKELHSIIYKELCCGEVRDRSRQKLLTIVEELSERGAKAIVLGCTELCLLIRNGDCSIPIYDSTELHSNYITDWSCNESQ